MKIAVRESNLDDLVHVVNYFHNASEEELKSMGINPERLLNAESLLNFFKCDFEKAVHERLSFLVSWLHNDELIGFSSLSNIVYQLEADMHLHIFDSQLRNKGLATQYVRPTTEIFFSKLELQKIFLEPNAFNIGANRTAQRTGFRYVKSYVTIPGQMSFQQPVTQWVLETSPASSSSKKSV